MIGKKMSLKQKLISLVFSVPLILGIMSFGVLEIISKKVTQQEMHSFESYSRSLSDAIGAQFYERYGDVQTFSLSPTLQAHDRKVITQSLNTFSAMYGIYDLIMVVNAKGKLVAVNDKSPDGKPIEVASLYSKNYSDAPWFKSVMENKTLEDKDKGFSGTAFEDVHVDPYTSEVYGSQRLGNSFSTAIKDESGNVIGVISNRAGSRWFEVAFKELYRSLKNLGMNHNDVVLLGKDGTLLFEYDSDPKSAKLEDSKYDWNQLLKYNFVKDEFTAATLLQKGESGAGTFLDPREKIPHTTGYSKVTGPKFIDSIGWGVMVRNSSADEGLAELYTIKKAFYVAFGMVILVSLFLSIIFSSSIARVLSSLAERLTQGSGEVALAAKSITDSGQKLSESVSEQAASIQETAAALEQVGSMLKSSSDNAQKSKSASEFSRQTSEEGKKSIDQMIHAIQEINLSNETIMKEVDRGNAQISEIVKLIQEIGQKTKVINDIVFQTKLLSFNASVEAARAGEHGKGFAVVAEEVGNLAQMSGTAAKEISSLLESSTERVEKIVSETKTNVGREALAGKQKVDAGTKIAKQCGELLDQILSSAENLDSMVSQISVATREQTQGVTEINKAMGQLDQVTNQNSGIAHTTATAAEQLSREAESLSGMVGELLSVVNGGKNVKNTTPAIKAAAPKTEIKVTDKTPKKAEVAPASRQDDKAKAPLKVVASPTPSTPADSGLGVPRADDPRFEDL